MVLVYVLYVCSVFFGIGYILIFFLVWFVVLRRFDVCGYYLDYINFFYLEDFCIKI